MIQIHVIPGWGGRWKRNIEKLIISGQIELMSPKAVGYAGPTPREGRWGMTMQHPQDQVEAEVVSPIIPKAWYAAVGSNEGLMHVRFKPSPVIAI